MPRVTRSPLVRLLVGALALLLGEALFTARAAAGCGDYVRLGDEPAMAPHGAGHSRAPCPCEGPLCSRPHDAPAPAPAGAAPPAPQQEGVLDRAAPPGPSPALALALAPAVRPRPGHGTSIYPPPRSA